MRPYNTLFLLMSLDGKISTGDTDATDVDVDFPKIAGLKEGLPQYYTLEQETDLCFFITGRVLAKIGVNAKKDEPAKGPTTAVILDNEPHLTAHGLAYLAKKHERVMVVTTNAAHPVFAMQAQVSNITSMLEIDPIDFSKLFEKLREEYHIEQLTVQSGGTLNATLVREGFIDRVRVVVAPALIGGKNTPTLMDGESLHGPDELAKIKTLTLVHAKPLENSYVLLEYTVCIT